VGGREATPFKGPGVRSSTQEEPMFAVERTHPNGTTTMYGPMRRRKTAERVADRMATVGEYPAQVRELTPWRRALR
jgi:hypothetical protein